ncbi:AraC family transcriptional regulator [Paraflavitalea sp. CAU 1676]|uniref:helix-turn-helix domain-containing protein n=1 Tax=Paraflavitalea sp. CAU 1676 TaxID=3032598 RepID=UPI0023DB99C6|nr:AraC family transcriptional regulator [Paraflavitalea sp. CAU 1676]MDF2187884.1 AraC family transcriptional regulator [Paraflavitalea sp. CAU 1676]
MTSHQFDYKVMPPPPDLAPFVESYWMLINQADEPRAITVLPDGRIDLIISRSATDPFHIALLGLEIGPAPTMLAPQTIMFATSFRLLAVEYLLKTSVAGLLNEGLMLPADHWGLSENDLRDFDGFCATMNAIIRERITGEPDGRKVQLFELIYASQGEMPVKELADKVYWSRRQINRYFTQQFGLSLKSYCSILRFRAAFPQIKEGKLFPELNFTDQAHFIREVKKFAGVTPRALHKNQDGRFIQFTTLPPE